MPTSVFHGGAGDSFTLPSQLGLYQGVTCSKQATKCHLGKGEVGRAGWLKGQPSVSCQTQVSSWLPGAPTRGPPSPWQENFPSPGKACQKASLLVLLTSLSWEVPGHCPGLAQRCGYSSLGRGPWCPETTSLQSF